MEFESRLKAAKEEDALVSVLYQDYQTKAKDYANLMWLKDVKQKISNYKVSKSNDKVLFGSLAGIVAMTDVAYFGLMRKYGLTGPGALTPSQMLVSDLIFGITFPAAVLGIYLLARRSQKKKKQEITDDIVEGNFEEKVKRIEEVKITAPVSSL